MTNGGRCGLRITSFQYASAHDRAIAAEIVKPSAAAAMPRPRNRAVVSSGHEKNRGLVAASLGWDYSHPAANFCRKHEKSATFNTGSTVEPSQLAYGSPAANFCRKQEKSATFSTGSMVEPSQLA
jgi:hypothetical protein